MVLTSSIAAVSTGMDVGGTYSEKDWTDASKPITPYLKSKVHCFPSDWLEENYAIT